MYKKNVTILYNITMISIIVAFTKNNVIGKDGHIPWDLPDDREHFKKLTFGSVIIMGRKSFEEIFKKFGAGLPGRETIVLSTTTDFCGDNYRSAVSLQNAINFSKKNFPEKNIFICGGESVYREALNLKIAETLYITEIDASFDGDTFFPSFDKTEYTITETEDIINPLPHRFVKYELRDIFSKFV